MRNTIDFLTALIVISCLLNIWTVIQWRELKNKFAHYVAQHRKRNAGPAPQRAQRRINPPNYLQFDPSTGLVQQAIDVEQTELSDMLLSREISRIKQAKYFNEYDHMDSIEGDGLNDRY